MRAQRTLRRVKTTRVSIWFEAAFETDRPKAALPGHFVKGEINTRSFNAIVFQ